jgi:hypothetical protein
MITTALSQAIRHSKSYLSKTGDKSDKNHREDAIGLVLSLLSPDLGRIINVSRVAGRASVRRSESGSSVDCDASPEAPMSPAEAMPK